jgi:hypothetical protein
LAVKNLKFFTLRDTNTNKNFATLRVVDKDINTLDSAMLRKQYFDCWLKTNITVKLVDNFDPLTETFDDLIARYNLICIDDQLDNFIYRMMVDTFGPNGGWRLDKYYKLKSQPILDMYFDGHAFGRRYYGNNFKKEDYYAKAKDAINKIVSAYLPMHNS